MAPALLALVLAAPDASRFVLEVKGVPIAAITATIDGDAYTYEAVHFLEEGTRGFKQTFALSKLPKRPEVVALLTLPQPGCTTVMEERSGKDEALCVQRLQSGKAVGTLAGERFVATYPEGRLARIEVGGATWVRDATRSGEGLASPFEEGVPVEKGPLAVEPGVRGATWSAPVLGIGEGRDRRRCLVLAREATAKRRGSRLAVGLVLEGGRAFPHAWIVERGQALDPSVVKGDPVLSERRYLEVPREESGRFFLELFDGQVRVTAP